MKDSLILFFLVFTLLGVTSCKNSTSVKNFEKPVEILKKTIENIDTISTLYYKQDMVRTNPRDIHNTIYRFREMYFKRLIQDSIVGVKGHWYMYVDDKVNVIYEDIYDGNKLVRKNNIDSVARIFDLVKYPEFKESHFWGHNTPYSMQFMFKKILENHDFYSINRLNDTIYQDTDCFQILIRLEDKGSMPGYAYKLQNEAGNVAVTSLLIDKANYYPVRMIMENYSKADPEQLFFTDQTWYDIKFNVEIDTIGEFNASGNDLGQYEIIEVEPGN